MMCVHCCSFELENHLQTVTTVDCCQCLLTLRYLLTLHGYLLSHVTVAPWSVDSALTAAVKDKRKTQNLTRVTVTLRHQTLPADSDRN